MLIANISIAGQVRNISLSLWTRYTHLTVLYLNDNKLDRISPEIAKLTNLQYLDLSNNRYVRTSLFKKRKYNSR